MNSIRFKNPYRTVSIGRNGSIVTTGITICEGFNDITIIPITSRGKPANCAISIPKAELNNVIEMIDEFTRENENN